MISQLKLNDSQIFEKRLLEKEKLRLAQYQVALNAPSVSQPKKDRARRVSFGFR